MMRMETPWIRFEILDDVNVDFLSPADEEWIFEGLNGFVQTFVYDNTIFLEAIDNNRRSMAMLNEAAESIESKLPMIFGDYKTERSTSLAMKTNVDPALFEPCGKGPYGLGGPFEAGSTVKLVDYVDALTELFPPEMTLGEIEKVVYQCFENVTMCPNCSGRGRFSKEQYCKRCAGTGYIYYYE